MASISTSHSRFSFRVPPMQQAGGIAIGAGLTFLLATWGADLPYLLPVRLALGIAYILYLPGYCLTTALFPGHTDLDGVERISLAIGLSIALIPVVALGLDVLPWGIRLWTILATEYGLIVTGIGITTLRRALAPTDIPPATPPQRRGWLPVLLLGLIVTVIVVSVGGIAYFNSTTSVYTGTEFYMLGELGTADHYPRAATVGAGNTITIGIANHDSRIHQYRVRTELYRPDGSSEVLEEIRLGDIAAHTTLETPLSWAMPDVGPNQRVNITLWLDNDSAPSRRLQLWLDVGKPTP